MARGTGRAALRLHSPGGVAGSGLLNLGVTVSAAQIANLPAVGLDLLPVVAAIRLAFGQHLRHGGSGDQDCGQRQEQGQ